MRIIPEYEPVGKLYLSFAQDFFHSRFNYGRTICEMARAVADRITVEVFVSEDETEFFLDLLEQNDLKPDEIVLNHDSPERGIILGRVNMEKASVFSSAMKDWRVQIVLAVFLLEFSILLESPLSL
ncbi:MAG: hypothetical protein K8S15_09065 [Candidatus Aegiribacteria sp.]|nr:hypothetical protein [Candidatus Aegiribacteria sp.]